MSKVTMPEPHGIHFSHESTYSLPQMEAYADARVREAIEDALIEVMRCKTSGIIRNDTVDKCADAIRALIPPTE